jgi:D-arabinose 1-dehydrogenase-like Zn-dependent alcohol dehydrogenase
MKFSVLTEPYRFEMKELPVPEPADNDVLIATSKVGICGSEITVRTCARRRWLNM